MARSQWPPSVEPLSATTTSRPHAVWSVSVPSAPGPVPGRGRVTDKRPQTIQIYLPHGEPRGIRVADVTTRAIHAVHVPRALMDVAGEIEELRGVGVYFLVGESEGAARPTVYVGEAEDCLVRLKQHNAKKDFWQHAVVILSQAGKFTKAHVKYLEWYCLGRAKEAGRFTLDNGNASSEPHVPKPLMAEILDAFDVLSTLTSTLGFPVVEAQVQKPPATTYTLSPKKSSVEARGYPVDDGFLVLAGSTAAATVRTSAGAWVSRHRDELSAAGILDVGPSGTIFRESYVFKSPSAAASAVLGGNTNGWVAWKLPDGRTLSDVVRREDGAAEA